jgi:hypothetical protein
MYLHKLFGKSKYWRDIKWWFDEVLESAKYFMGWNKKVSLSGTLIKYTKISIIFLMQESVAETPRPN